MGTAIILTPALRAGLDRDIAAIEAFIDADSPAPGTAAGRPGRFRTGSRR